MTSPKTTIKDIAKALGLSFATVSRSLNNSHEVSEETRMRVLSKARELSYKPNIHARNLLKRRNNMVGVVVPEFTTFFFPEIIIGIQEVLNAEGYQVLICQSNESATLERRNIEMLESSMVEGSSFQLPKMPKTQTSTTELLAKEHQLCLSIVCFLSSTPHKWLSTTVNGHLRLSTIWCVAATATSPTWRATNIFPLPKNDCKVISMPLRSTAFPSKKNTSCTLACSKIAPKWA